VNHAKGVTLLVTHYNRSESLARLLESFKKLDFTFEDIVVSDDGSLPEHGTRLQQLAEQYRFRLITTPVNRGLGNNLNKGQDAVKTPYTLYVQVDFIPTAVFPQRFQDGFELMEERNDFDMVRFYAHKPYPNLKPYKRGFSEMVFKLTQPGTEKFFYYSDTPHLRRSNFFERFGRYAEGVRAIKGEKFMVMSFLQHHGKALQCDESNIFQHSNSEEEPSTQDYSAFFRIKNKVPDSVFDVIWTGKLTTEYLLKRYRH
jgi:glycosyltransferase involved in cell wall biosynthesis